MPRINRAIERLEGLGMDTHGIRSEVWAVLGDFLKEATCNSRT